MNISRHAYSVVLAAIMHLISTILAAPRSVKAQGVILEPTESIAYAGDTVSFTCSYPENVTFVWDYNDSVNSRTSIKTGVTLRNKTNDSELYWSKLNLVGVKRFMSGEITCSIKGTTKSSIAFLVVNGVKIRGRCTSNDDCITDKAICKNGSCSCPEKDVLLRLSESGYEVCRKMSYKLYDPCEFSEECFHLVDSKSVCATNGICVCGPWFVDVNGKCVSKGQESFNKNQELYRVGLVAITCLIIVIIAISLWITLKKSCRHRNSGGSRRTYVTQRSDSAGHRNSSISEISEDKPPSYDDALEATEIATSPPNFKEALTSSMTAKKLLRQVSAPAGQLLSRTTSFTLSPSGKRNKPESVVQTA